MKATFKNLFTRKAKPDPHSNTSLPVQLKEFSASGRDFIDAVKTLAELFSEAAYHEKKERFQTALDAADLAHEYQTLQFARMLGGDAPYTIAEFEELYTAQHGHGLTVDEIDLLIKTSAGGIADFDYEQIFISTAVPIYKAADKSHRRAGKGCLNFREWLATAYPELRQQINYATIQRMQRQVIYPFD